MGNCFFSSASELLELLIWVLDFWVFSHDGLDWLSEELVVLAELSIKNGLVDGDSVQSSFE